MFGVKKEEAGNLVVIGDVLLDRYIYGDVSRISPEAPVPVLKKEGSYFVGGGAANVAANARSLGSHVQLIGVVGRDRTAKDLEHFLGEENDIDTSLLVEESGWPTISKTRVVCGDQQIVRIDDEKVITFSSTTKEKLKKNIRQALARADAVVLSDYGKGVFDRTLFAGMVKQARQRKLPVIVDPKNSDFSLYEGATLLTPNRRELANATGGDVSTEKGIIEAGRKACAMAGCDILVTRSEDGMTFIGRNGEIHHERAQKAEVFDVSGAGDTVVATIASVLAQKGTVEEAMHLATIAASIVVGRSGTSIVSLEELQNAAQEDPLHGALVASPEKAASIVKQWHRHHEKVVFTNGCFDLIHPGHIQILREAARLGDKLVVGLNSDASIRRLKGPTRPVQNQQDRIAIMSALRGVDMVVLFGEDTPLTLIEKLCPDILVKGADYQGKEVVGGDFVKAHGGEVVLVPLLEGRSTTNLLRQKEKSA